MERAGAHLANWMGISIHFQQFIYTDSFNSNDATGCYPKKSWSRICYIDFFFKFSVFTSGSVLRIRPSNLMKFALYGWLAPSKTERSFTYQHPRCLYHRASMSNMELTLQPFQPGLPQLVLRQHATDRPLQYLPSSPFPHHTLHVQRL